MTHIIIYDFLLESLGQFIRGLEDTLRKMTSSPFSLDTDTNANPTVWPYFKAHTSWVDSIVEQHFITPFFYSVTEPIMLSPILL